MRMRRWMILLVAVSAVMATMALGGLSQQAASPVRVLVVDQTKTFTSTMRVAGLVGGLRSMGIFEVGVVLGETQSAYGDPLAEQLPQEAEAPYDLIAILPRGLDDGTTTAIWVVSAGLGALSPNVAGALTALTGTIDLVFAEIGEAIDVSEDLWPGLLWAVYATKGWIR